MKYLIEKSQNKIMSYLLGADGKAVEIRADQPEDGLKPGDIVIGRVEQVSAATGACFVRIAKDLKGYLPFEEMADPTYTRKGPSKRVQQGDELVVQISREAFGQKDMSLTTKLQLNGRYLVLQRCGTGLGISRKIADERRKDLKDHLFTDEIFRKLDQILGECGIIVRTNAEHAPDSRIRKELDELSAAMQHILLTAPYRTACTVLFRQPDRWLKRTDSLPMDKVDQILTDDRELYDRLAGYLPAAMAEKLRLYQDDMISMHNVFSLTRELSHALTKKVNLKSGANLVIEQTEALVAIDVNSARSVKGKDKEKAALAVNLEAAREVARQIRLRSLSGMILVDFINMEEDADYETLMHELRMATAADPMRVAVIDRTALGLVEMTRRKVEVPLPEQMK